MNMDNNLMVIVPKCYLERLNAILENAEHFLREKAHETPNWMWVESKEARKMFNVSAKTWQTWRDQRFISFSQFGNKIYYNLDDLNSFMEQHKINTL